MKIAKQSPAPGGQTYKIREPFSATVVSVERISAADSTEDIRHIIMDITGSNLHYVEGQSVGVIPPGSMPEGKPHKLRLYSIASPRQGDADQPNRLGLCVKRVVEDQGHQTYYGVASNYLCDLKPGDKVSITGPVGPTFVLPEDTGMNLILVATGTGIAPFRAMLQYIYQDTIEWSGRVMLVYGARTSKEAVYMNTVCDDLSRFHRPGRCSIYTALSREQTNAVGGKMYVQNRLEENLDELTELMTSENFSAYLCGLKGMGPGVEAAVSQAAERLGRNWDEWKLELKKAGKWNVEVY
ncbi:MAG: hypothetical protein KDK30_03255 [Leptospiraceae bacterium]|nr:hypothetical protein [Leptospiraceae bacterium]